MCRHTTFFVVFFCKGTKLNKRKEPITTDEQGVLWIHKPREKTSA